MADTIVVRIFELLCVGLWLAGLRWIRRQKNPVYSGAYFGSSTLFLFDWMFNSNWFFRVEFDAKFIDLWRIQGVSEPLAMAFNYAFYFGAPVVLLAHHREAIDRRFGRKGWLVVFLGACAILPMFECPMVSWAHLWTYYQKPGFELWGVPWSNIWYSGVLTTTCYGAVRLAVRWARVPVSVGGGGAAPESAEASNEDRWRGMAMGAAGIWAAFYVSMLLQLAWYALTQPWVATPRPF